MFLFVSLFSLIEAQITTFQLTYGDAADNVGNDIRQTADGGYIMVGRTYQSYPTTSISDSSFLVKFDQNGNVDWTKNFSVSSLGLFKSVIQTHDSAYAVTGSGLGNFLMAKMNSFGDTLWTFHRPDSITLVGNSIIETSDHGFIIVGNAPYPTYGCCYHMMIKVDSMGQYEWGGSGSFYGRMYEIVQTINDKYTVVSNQITGPPFLRMKKINSNGTGIWEYNYFSAAISYVAVPSIDITADGGYITGGADVMRSSKMNSVKIDSSGNFVWAKKYYSYGGIIRSAVDSGFYSLSNVSPTGGDIRIMKLNSIGDSLWAVNYGGSNEESYSNMHTTNDCGLVAIGTTQSFGAGNRDVYIIKTDCNGLAVSINNNVQINNNPVSVYPNPSSGVFNFNLESNKHLGSTICIYNSSGILVNNIEFDYKEQIINLAMYSNGIYFYQIKFENSIIASGKLTKN